MIDVSNQSHINITQGQWPRCRDVTLRDDVLEYRLDFARTYSLLEAYRRAPHVEFANATTDRDLVSFMRKWGPLALDPPTPGVMSLSLPLLRAEQRWFHTLMGLLYASRRAEREAEALRAYIEAEYEQANQRFGTIKDEERDLETEPILFMGEPLPLVVAEHFSRPLSALRGQFHIKGSIPDWARSVDLRTARAARACLIPLLPEGAITRLVCGRRYIEAGWNLFDLKQALSFYLWYDLFTKHPIICCPECARVKRARSAHPNQKFCSQKCEHRATARAWQNGYNKRKRAEQRKERK